MSPGAAESARAIFDFFSILFDFATSEGVATRARASMGCVTSASVEPAGSPEAKTEARVPAQTIAKVLARKGANVVRMARSVDTLFNAFCTRPEVDPMATLTAVLLYLSAADRSLDLDGDEARSIKRIFDNHLGKLLRQASTCKEGRSATEGRPWAAGARETMLAGLRAAQAQCSSDDELEDFLRDLHAAYGRVLNVPCIPRAEALLREYVIDIGLNKWASKNLPFSDDDTAAYRNFSAEQIAAFDELDADHCGDEDFFLIQHRKVLGAFFEISESGGGDGKMDSIEDDDDENEATGAKTASEDSPSTPSEALPAKTIKDFKSVSEIGSLAQMGYTYDRWGTVPTEGFVKKVRIIILVFFILSLESLST